MRSVVLALVVVALTLLTAQAEGLETFVATHDFRTYYTGGFMVRNGAGPELGTLEAQLAWQQRVWPVASLEFLQPVWNPPAFSLVVAPFTLLGPVPAYVAWLLALGVVLVFFLKEVGRALPPSSERRVLFVVAFPPVLVAAVQAQPSYLLALAFLLAFRELERGNDLRAGLWLALVGLKPQLAFIPAIYLLKERRWRALAGLAIGAAAWVALSVLVTGPQGFVAWTRLIASAARLTGMETFHRAEMQSVMGLLAFFAGETSPALRAAWAVACGLTVLAVILFPRGAKLELGWSLVVVASVFASPHLHFHDLTLLIVPAILVTRAGVLNHFPRVGFALSWLGFFTVGQLPPLAVLFQVAAGTALFLSARKTGKSELPGPQTHPTL